MGIPQTDLMANNVLYAITEEIFLDFIDDMCHKMARVPGNIGIFAPIMESGI